MGTKTKIIKLARQYPGHIPTFNVLYSIIMLLKNSKIDDSIAD